MNTLILNTEIQEFINSNLNSNIGKILLKGTAFSGVTTQEIVEQIEAKKRCKTKLPSWFNCSGMYYPNKLNIEQTSSEITAKYKSQLIEGNTIVDLTGGFGIDCYYFSKRFKHVTHCEIDAKLSHIVTHNYKQLNVNTIKTINTNGIDYLNHHKQNFDWIYIDPSRRHDSKGKVFFLKDCLPNVPQHMDMLFEQSKNIMIKTSPLLDLSVGIKELNHVKTINIVAVENEVKELLWILEKGYTHTISIKTVNIKKEKRERFDFTLDTNMQLPSYSLPLSYVYEPNTAILKSGGFDTVATKFNIYKLHQNSHLYTTDKLIDFPGRTFKIDHVIPYNKKEFKKLKLDKANITTRNFPESVQALRKKWHIKDGGDIYLFFTTNLENKKIVLVTSKQS